MAEHLDVVRGLLQSPGVEIGAFNTPIPGISPIYVDRFGEYANQPTLADYFGDSADLPFVDSSLNYVASSHVIEHVANPLDALMEWYRVLRDGGIIYMTVPDRRFTFDKLRPLTDVEHMIQDYQRHTTQCDGTHIQDYVFNVDWAELSPQTPADQVAAEREALSDTYQRAVSAGNEINIHFHTFEPNSFVQLVRRANEVLPLNGGRIKVERVEAPFPTSLPNGFLVVARVRKPGGVRGVRGFLAPKDILRPDARKFAKVQVPEWDERNFPEVAYLRLHEDVASAVARGEFKSGFMHYSLFGKKERRRVH